MRLVRSRPQLKRSRGAGEPWWWGGGGGGWEMGGLGAVQVMVHRGSGVPVPVRVPVFCVSHGGPFDPSSLYPVAVC
jgi:hypothetical protein